MVEFWRAGGSASTTSAELARRIEAEGWDGQMFMDSQSLGCDPYVMMGVWAAATERLKLCTGVTNPLTRHPAVTASAAATVQSITNGRAVLGIGRGDSALAYLGYAPVRLRQFERTLLDLQTLLSGGSIGFGGAAPYVEADSIERLSLGHRPEATQLKWLPKELPKVPLDVAATGPKVIGMAAAIAERVTFSVGAIPERIRWAIDTARSARKERELPEAGVSYGAQIIVVCHPDIEAVRALATSFVAPLARFQVIDGKKVGPEDASTSADLEKITRGYDMREHGKAASDKKLGDATLSWDFVSRFAIIGAPDYCTQRLLELADAGLERFVVVGPGFHPEARSDGKTLFATEVMPAVRTELRKRGK